MRVNFNWFEDLYRKLFVVVYQQFRGNNDLAHGAAAQCWIEAVQKPDGFFPSWENLLRWGLFVAKRRAVDLLRQERRTRLARLPEDLPGQLCQNVQWLLAREVAVECMADLPAKDRQLLDGHYWEGLSDRELAPDFPGDGHSSDAQRQATRRRRKHTEQAFGRLLLARHPEVAEAVTGRA